MKRFLALSIVSFTTLTAAFASAELSIGADASGKADSEGADADADAKAEDGETESAPEGASSDTAEAADEEEAAEAKAEEEKEEAEAPESDASEGADKNADAKGGKTTHGSDEIAYGGVYTFGKTGGHVMGIPHGSLSGNSHGLHSDYRRSGLMLSGDTWIDTGYRATETDLATTLNGNEREFIQQGRFMLRVTPTYSKGNWFAKAQGEILALSDMKAGQVYVDTDDAWIKFGYWDLFDVQVGRFEAWEVYHKGMGLERNTLEDQGATPSDHSRPGVVDMYEVNRLLYRQEQLGQAAIHVYPARFARVELATVMGLEGDLTTRCPVEPQFRPAADAVPGQATQARQSCIFPWGLRPAAILDFDFVRLKAAWERMGMISRQETELPVSSAQSDRLYQGFGGQLQFILDPHVELGGGFAQGTEDIYSQNGALDRGATVERTTFGGFINGRLEIISPVLSGFVLGAGFNQTNNLTQDCGPVPVRDPVTGVPINDAAGMPLYRDTCGEQSHTQYFAAIQHDILERATIKLVVGLADADLRYGPNANSADEKTDMFSVRARALIWY